MLMMHLTEVKPGTYLV